MGNSDGRGQKPPDMQPNQELDYVQSPTSTVTSPSQETSKIEDDVTPMEENDSSKTDIAVVGTQTQSSS
ncbi:putative microtubule-actin cross-linking factor 1 [Sesbania bispinosa]|nr:putative microtubule-actin cross-linking factor 1 [Sesbania bispinosa]